MFFIFGRHQKDAVSELAGNGATDSDAGKALCHATDEEALDQERLPIQF